MRIPRLGLKKLLNHRKSVPVQATGLGRQMRHAWKSCQRLASTEACGQRQTGHLLGIRGQPVSTQTHVPRNTYVSMHPTAPGCPYTSICIRGQSQLPQLGKGCQETQTLSGSCLNSHGLSYTTAEAESERHFTQSARIDPEYRDFSQSLL